MHGGRGRVTQGPTSSSSVDGPNIEELVGSGVQVDVLKQLITKDKKEVSSEEPSEEEGGLRKLISLDQVTLRGEDLTGERLMPCMHNMLNIINCMFSKLAAWVSSVHTNANQSKSPGFKFGKEQNSNF